jgi:predicted metal-dependent HD superfamily phosphohydrolase
VIDWRELPLPVSPDHVEALARWYGGPDRHYHTLVHIAELLDLYRQVAREVGWANPREVLAALLYHDAVYVPGAPDNEARSAVLATTAIESYWAAFAIELARVQGLILLTAKHGAALDASPDPDAALFLDCDLAILGAPWARYRAYEAEIAAEYAALPLELFRSGRRAFLRRLLDSERLYRSSYFEARLEQAARANLARALAIPLEH